MFSLNKKFLIISIILAICFTNLSSELATNAAYGNRLIPMGWINTQRGALASANPIQKIIEEKIIDPVGLPNDNFGTSIAISGDTVIVGSPRQYNGPTEGSALIFTRVGKNWFLQQKIFASDGSAGDLFGSSVAIYGDTALIGAPHDRIGSNENQGSAYLFTRIGSTWVQQTKLIAPDGEINDMFANSLSLSENTALIGACGASKAYVYAKTNGVWGLQQTLIPSNVTSEPEFGISVALSGNTALVGAYNDYNSYGHKGSAYIYVQNQGTWSLQQKLIGFDGDLLGCAVALDGDTALIGTLAERAYIYNRAGTLWTQQAILSPFAGESSSHFGQSVALLNDTAMVSAFVSESVYVYTRNGFTWNDSIKLRASDGPDGWYGFSVALTDKYMLVTNLYDTINGNIGQGSAYLYHIENIYPLYFPSLIKK